MKHVSPQEMSFATALIVTKKCCLVSHIHAQTLQQIDKTSTLNEMQTVSYSIYGLTQQYVIKLKVKNICNKICIDDAHTEFRTQP